MSASETLQTVILAIEANDFTRARGYLTDDFTFDGAVPQPIGPDAWLSIHRAFNTTMPDFSFNARGVHDENGGAVGQMQITGTQTNELTLPLPGIPPLSGKVKPQYRCLRPEISSSRPLPAAPEWSRPSPPIPPMLPPAAPQA